MVRLIALCAALIGVGSAAAFAGDEAANRTPIPFDSVRAIAENYVAKELPAGGWPFEVADTHTLATAEKSVCRLFRSHPTVGG